MFFLKLKYMLIASVFLFIPAKDFLKPNDLDEIGVK